MVAEEWGENEALRKPRGRPPAAGLDDDRLEFKINIDILNISTEYTNLQF